MRLCARVSRAHGSLKASDAPRTRQERPSTKGIHMSEVRNITLVHGGFVDGSGWEGVYRLLLQEGFQVHVVQNPTLSLYDDAAVTRRVLDQQDGPTILVGHSYGGAVIREGGTHNNVGRRSHHHTRPPRP